MDAEEALRFAARVSADPARIVSRWKALTGGKAVSCRSPLAPEEVLHAAGALPVNGWRWGAWDEGAPCDIPRCNLIDGFVLSGGPKERDDAQRPGKPAAGRFFFPQPASGFPEAGMALEGLVDAIEAFCEWAAEFTGRSPHAWAVEKAIRLHNDNRRHFSSLGERMAGEPGRIAGTLILDLVRAGAVLPVEAHTPLLRAAEEWGSRYGRRVPSKAFIAGEMPSRRLMAAIDRTGAVVGVDWPAVTRYEGGDIPEEGDPVLTLSRRLADASRPRDPEERMERALDRALRAGANRLVVVSLPPVPEGIPTFVVDPATAIDGRAGIEEEIERFLATGKSGSLP